MPKSFGRLNGTKYAKLICILTGLFAGLCSNLHAQSTVDPENPGPYSVGFEALQLDFTRAPSEGNRILPMQMSVWYPSEGTGLFQSNVVSNSAHKRVIVYSHGHGSVRTENSDLLETLASHGFIVISPEHRGATSINLLDFVLFRGFQAEWAVVDSIDGRVEDITACID